MHISVPVLVKYTALKYTSALKIYYFKRKKVDKNQESIQSSITPDPGYQWESDNFTI